MAAFAWWGGEVTSGPCSHVRCTKSVRPISFNPPKGPRPCRVGLGASKRLAAADITAWHEAVWKEACRAGSFKPFSPTQRFYLCAGHFARDAFDLKEGEAPSAKTLIFGHIPLPDGGERSRTRGAGESIGDAAGLLAPECDEGQRALPRVRAALREVSELPPESAFVPIGGAPSTPGAARKRRHSSAGEIQLRKRQRESTGSPSLAFLLADREFLVQQARESASQRTEALEAEWALRRQATPVVDMLATSLRRERAEPAAVECARLRRQVEKLQEQLRATTDMLKDARGERDQLRQKLDRANDERLAAISVRRRVWRTGVF